MPALLWLHVKRQRPLLNWPGLCASPQSRCTGAAVASCNQLCSIKSFQGMQSQQRDPPGLRHHKVVARGLKASGAGRAKLAAEDLVQAAVGRLAEPRPGVAVGHHLHTPCVKSIHTSTRCSS